MIMGTQRTCPANQRLRHSAAYTRDSIWSLGADISFTNTIQSVFRATNQVPGVIRVYPKGRSQVLSENSTLSEEAEYQLAQDWAFIAVHDEGAHTVSASTVERKTEDGCLAISIAVNDGVADKVRSTFGELGSWLGKCARKGISPAFNSIN